MLDKKYIGIFDSGIGGLTVARAIKERMPSLPLIYFGDTAHLPYGDKSPESILQYAKKIMQFLYEKGCTHIVVACNSASSVLAKNGISTYKSIPIINVVDPVVDYLSSSDLSPVGIIGTKATVNSSVYEQKLLNSAPHLEVKSLATPLLAPMIEEGFFTNKISKVVINEYIKDEKLKGIKTLVLACTHYPLIRDEIQTMLPRIPVLDNAELTAKMLEAELGDTRTHYFASEDLFYVSDYTEAFRNSTRFFFGEKLSLNVITL
jgi:glutamate racemase